MAVPTINELLDFLERGKENAITAEQIANNFNCSDGGTDVPIRGVIRDSIEDGQLIGSTNKGFFIINTNEEFNNYYINSLNGRIIGIARRIEKLHEAWASREQ